MRELEGNHDNSAWADNAVYRAALAEFLGTLALPRFDRPGE